ncbi:hypothetical protein SESBI_19144 [Sesbania bispinosa]|nr:hypothetical protein SESBI_19144 [Sesbania bispinosa]
MTETAGTTTNSQLASTMAAARAAKQQQSISVPKSNFSSSRIFYRRQFLKFKMKCRL